MQFEKQGLLRAAGVALLSLALAACGHPTIGSVPASPSSGNSGGSGGGGSGAPTSPTVSIDTLSVQGSNGATAVSQSGNTPGMALIDGNLNNGFFSVGWNTTLSDDVAELITISLSASASGTGDDPVILQRSCNTSGTDCTDTSALFQCRFDEANMQVDCPLDGTPQDIGNYLANNGGLPGNYFLVMQACVTDISGNAVCDLRSLPVNLQ